MKDPGNSEYAIFMAVLLSGYLHYRFIIEPFYLSDHGKVHIINCQQKDGEATCQNRRTGILRRSFETEEFKLIDSSVEDYFYDDGHSSYRLYLETDAGKVELEDYGGRLDQANEDADRFKSLLTDDRETSVSLKYGNGLIKNLMLLFVGAVFFWPIFLVMAAIFVEIWKWILWIFWN